MAAPTIVLSELETIDPRLVWPGEASHFTPWLLEHPDVLEKALGIDLELTAAEHPVGNFSLDLIGRDLTNDGELIVENQLTITDHTHLGQVLTYAAGTNAATIVWIATEFRDEHRQALDWLNQTTGEDTHFFGIQLKVVKIGDSAPAPLLEVVSEPNDWQKMVQASSTSTVSPKGALYRQFWSRYLERLRAEHPTWSNSKTAPTSNWITQPSPIKGSVIGLSFAAGRRLRHDVYIDVGDSAENLLIFDRLALHRADIEAAYGGPLEFDPLTKKQACRIAAYREASEVTNVEQHEAYIDWFFDTGARLRAAHATVDTRSSS